MTDYPPGKWSQILVGNVWPAGSNLNILASASTHFSATAAAYHRFRDQLNQARSGPLGGQEGITADDLRSTFHRGEKQALDVAEKNETKQAACDLSYSSVRELRAALTTVAADGNSQIDAILGSKDLPTTKIERVIDVVLNCQTRANGNAANCAQNIISAMQNILSRDGSARSALQFTKDHGLDIGHMFGSPNKDAIRQQVMAAVDPSSSLHGTGESDVLRPESGKSFNPENASLTGARDALPVVTATGNRRIGSILQTGQADGLPRPAPAPLPSPIHLGSEGPISVAGTIPPRVPAPGLSNVSAPTPVASANLSTGITPSELMQSFDHGMQTGTPMSAATQALTGGPLNAVEPQLQTSTPHIPETAVAPTPPSTAHAPVFDAPHPTHTAAAAPVPPPSAPPSEATTTYVAGPVGPAAPAPAALAPAGPMPSYGADIRPPAPTASVLPTTPAGSTPSASAAAPTSSPAGTGGLGQPAVVRQTAAAPAVPQTPAGVTEQAVAAASGGAAAGAVSAAATAGARLQRLIDAVARQEPRLRWAVGERADGTTVLVTDLASGWIPPDINVPVGVQLLAPAHRRGDIEVLLGEVSAAASYTPVHYLPAEEEEPVATSTRARHVPAVDELGWELGQATKWRDELPRLAHTLAKAASTGTGVLDSESKLLREHLAEVRDRVLDSYPDHVNANLVGNWQLLGAIDALVGGDTAGAHYHFAWFQALSQATTPGRPQ
ncbi:hypothetical protein MSIMFI_03462 [Mycobacterium simulans]|nr:hypothetical protein MSIMFI_03462 [Mycobacterium simulans]